MSPIDSPTEATRIYATNRFDFGREAGRVAGRRSRALVKALSSLAKRDVRASAIAAQASRQSLFAAQSELNEEIRGLAQALNMDATDLAATSALACSILVPGCTNFAAAPPATSDGQVMTSWNFDVPPYFRVLMGSFPMFVRELEGTIPYLCMGVPALFGIGILNAEGLSSVVNAVGMTDDGPGLSPFELNNIAMETCRSVDEAAAVFRDRPRRIMKAMYMGMLFNWNTIWADTRGGLSVFECSHNHFHQEKAGPDANLASANHHQFLDHSLTGSVDPSQDPLITGSYSRLPRMYALLREFHGSIDPFVAKRIISDHVPDYSELQEYGIEREWWQEKVDDSTICAHAWNLRRHLSKGELELATEEVGMSWTVYSFQVRPQRMTVWFTDGHPCRRLTTPYYWGRLLGAECEPDPGALDPASRSTRPEGARRGLFMEQSARATGRHSRRH